MPREAQTRTMFKLLPTTLAPPPLAPIHPLLLTTKPRSHPTTLVTARPTRMALRQTTLSLARLLTPLTALLAPCLLPILATSPRPTIKVLTMAAIMVTMLVVAHIRLNKLTTLPRNTTPLPTLNTLPPRNKTMVTAKTHPLAPILCKRERTHSTMEIMALLRLL